MISSFLNVHFLKIIELIRVCNDKSWNEQDSNSAVKTSFNCILRLSTVIFSVATSFDVFEFRLLRLLINSLVSIMGLAFGNVLLGYKPKIKKVLLYYLPDKGDSYLSINLSHNIDSIKYFPLIPDHNYKYHSYLKTDTLFSPSPNQSHLRISSFQYIHSQTIFG